MFKKIFSKIYFFVNIFSSSFFPHFVLYQLTLYILLTNLSYERKKELRVCCIHYTKEIIQIKNEDEWILLLCLELCSIQTLFSRLISVGHLCGEVMIRTVNSCAIPQKRKFHVPFAGCDGGGWCSLFLTRLCPI